ncbi:MAG TPA: type II secretion system protein [Phycisphaerae bacterium]|nr:type II secretion system protein [Phycisphaerae bacterium]
MQKERTTTAFTLMELLIVVAIISLLVSIMQPGLQRAKELARKAVCSSNIRHLAISNILYSENNDEYYIRAAEDLWGMNKKRWHGQRKNTSKPFDAALSPLIDYMGGSGLKKCPGFTAGDDYDDTAGVSAGFEAGCGGYGYNGTYIGARYDKYGMGPLATQNSASASDIVQPSQTVMFADCAYVTAIGGGNCKIAYSFCETPTWETGPDNSSLPTKPDPTIDFRHIGQVNVAWMDSHVSGEQMTFTLDYQSHSYITSDEAENYGIGWFGPQDNELFDLK